MRGSNLFNKMVRHSLLAAVFFSKGHLNECLIIVNAKGRYGGSRIGKKAHPCLVLFPFRLRRPSREKQTASSLDVNARKFLARRSRRGENLVEPTGSASSKTFGSERLWATVGRTVAKKNGWRNTRILVPPIAEGRTTSASHTKSLENGRDSKTSTTRESSGDVDLEISSFGFTRHCFRKCLENEEA